ncbi:glycosyltransferase family 2 protein [Vibrio cholerae]|uniref:glycosyltransferase family 2 protein n=1 Tax=Vibrio cholerae TaxID=666 RepID=UPI00015414E3|nr:glycosyltransferase family 2 protein [Vibrio cholerae]KNH52350.1 glycosyl transferase [Vibrio cholerae 623-39]BCN16921.1 putative glycosyltransferase [Vibrio cholerae]BCN19323.1 putative glycosyltransferase [Vibrio cholerae]GHX71793.1 glycosyltransferase [Vibrio cholerae]GIB93450.1 glycosyltransferase [Vibrio cholerae]
MLLSIVVLSYNRPLQVARILNNFVGVNYDEVELVIKDDQSPKFDEIRDIFESFKEKIGINTRIYKNPKNLGYDRNLLDAFKIVDSEYVFLLSDDDYVKADKLELVLRRLSLKDKDVFYTPYIVDGTGVINRNIKQETNKLIPKDFSKIIYNSILFSGMVYRRSSIVELDLDHDFLGNCIYTQVYLSVILVYKSQSFGILPSGFLFLGGDGENYFGKNESAINSNILVDRAKITSNLNYQPLLLSTVAKASQDTDCYIYKAFMKEYKLRLISYALRARALGFQQYLDFFIAYKKSDVPKFMIMNLTLLLITLIPSTLSRIIYSYGVNGLKKSG